jgi:serine protease Do
MYEDFLKKIRKNRFILLTIVANFAVSAVVGVVFGYYGATLIGDELNYPVQIDESSLPRGLDESTAVVSIVKKYSPAVVSIVATKDLPVLERTYGPFQEFCDDPFFSQFFDCKNQPELRQKGIERRQVGAGTGFIVKSDGLIVTNKHVVLDIEASYTVITSDGTKYPVEVLARDPFQDLAVVKIEAQELPVVVLGDSDGLEIGQTVVAIGNALGEFSNSVSKGIISGLSRSITASSGVLSERLENVIQTDTAINPGNSGGPLLNLRGEVVGINSAVAPGAQNVGFAIPINRAKKALRDIELQGRIVYPYLGVRYIIVNDEVRTVRNLPVDYGALAVRSDSGEAAVLADSPAAKSGLKEGDIILEVDGRRIDDNYTLAEAIQFRNVGDKVILKVRRGDADLTLEVTLEEQSS